jgi:hypothetical protein
VKRRAQDFLIFGKEWTFVDCGKGMKRQGIGLGRPIGRVGRTGI